MGVYMCPAPYGRMMTTPDKTLSQILNIQVNQSVDKKVVLPPGKLI